MGKHIENSELCNPVSSAYQACVNDTSIVTSTLMEIEATLRLLGKQTSLLQVNGERSELFSATEPSFALFADIINNVSSENESGGCYDDAVERSTVVDNAQTSSECTINECTIADESNKDHESEGNLISNQCVNESTVNTGSLKDHLHTVTEQHSGTDQSTANQVTIHQVPMDHTITDHSKTEQVSTDESTFDDAANDQSPTKHVNMHQNTTENTTDYTNTDNPSTEQSTMDHTMTDQSTGDQGDTEQSTTDYATMIDEQSTNDNAVIEQNIIVQEIHDNEMLDSTVSDQTRTTCTKTTDACTVAESVANNAIGERSVDHDMCVENSADTSILKTTNRASERAPENIASHDATVDNSNTTETQSNLVDYVENESSLNQTHSLVESAITECTVTNDTNRIQISTDTKSDDFSIVNIENTDDRVNHTWPDCSRTDNDEYRVDDKRESSTNIHEVMGEHLKTSHNCTENTDSTSNLSTAGDDTLKQFTSDHSIMHKNDVTSDKCDIGNYTTDTLNQSMEDSKDEASGMYVNGVTDGEKADTESAWSRGTENIANVNNNTSDDKNSMSQSETSEYSYFSSTELEQITDCTERLEEIKTNESIKEFTTLNSNTSNKKKEITTNDIDIDITVDSWTDEHLETMARTITDSIADNSGKHASMNDIEASESATSAADAVDRYVKKLEALIEAEKRQAQQFIEQTSRLWDSPFLCKNKY